MENLHYVKDKNGVEYWYDDNGTFRIIKYYHKNGKLECVEYFDENDHGIGYEEYDVTGKLITSYHESENKI